MSKQATQSSEAEELIVIDRKTRLKSWLMNQFVEHGMTYTVLAVSFILLIGVSIYQNPALAGVTVGFSVVVMALVFIVLNAMVVVKAALTIVVMLFLPGIMTQIAVIMDPHSVWSSLWGLSFLIMGLASLAYSYIFPRPRSRWSSLLAALVVSAILSVLAAVASLLTMVGALVAAVSIPLVFFFLYSVKGVRRAYKDMPENVTTDDIDTAITTSAEKNGWNVYHLHNKSRGEHSYIVWQDRAYLVIPIVAVEQFSVLARRTLTGRKKFDSRGYNNRPIEPWLRDIMMTRPLFWKSRGAPMTVVLLDVMDANGTKAKVFEVPMEDTKKLGIVGTFPMGDTLGKEGTSLVPRIDKAFQKITPELNTKQSRALLTVKNKAELQEAVAHSEDVDEAEEHVLDEEAQKPQSTEPTGSHSVEESQH